MSEPRSHSGNLQLLSRTPIFTTDKTVWGYEIKAMSTIIDDVHPARSEENITDHIISGDYIGLNVILARSKKLVLSYSWNQLLNQIPYAFPPQSSVILLCDDCQQDITLQPALEQYVKDGHMLALQWNPQITPRSFALPLSSIIRLASPAQADATDIRTLSSSKMCLVDRAETREEFDSLREAGVRLFQGRYFKTAEVIPGKKISSHQNSRMQIMRIIEAESPDHDQLAKTVQADVTLSYRLLLYLNSPTFGFVRRIESIRQAITLLGWTNVRNWLRAVLLTDMAQGEQQKELLHVSLQRGRFLEQLVTQYNYWDFKPDKLFLLGIFSLLDALLGIPMQEALTYLPLTENQKIALQGKAPTEYAPLLHIMLSLEDEDESVFQKAILDLSMNPADVRQLHYEAGAWASDILAADA